MPNGVSPAIALISGLMLPFEEMEEKNSQAVDQFAVQAFSHIFYFFSKMFPVYLSEPASSE